MSVVIPPTHANESLTAIASKVTTLAAIPSTVPHYTASQLLLAQTQTELVEALLDWRKLQAATIISTLPVLNKSNPLYSKITAQNTLITAYGATAPAGAANQALDTFQRQLVIEEMASGQRTAASILSTMSYMGA
jgi:hypothetical protein